MIKVSGLPRRMDWLLALAHEHKSWGPDLTLKAALEAAAQSVLKDVVDSINQIRELERNQPPDADQEINRLRDLVKGRQGLYQYIIGRLEGPRPPQPIERKLVPPEYWPPELSLPTRRRRPPRPPRPRRQIRPRGVSTRSRATRRTTSRDQRRPPVCSRT